MRVPAWSVAIILLLALAGAVSGQSGGGGSGGSSGGSTDYDDTPSGRRREPVSWLAIIIVVVLIVCGVALMCACGVFDPVPLPPFFRTPEHTSWSGTFVGSRGRNSTPHTTRAALRFHPSATTSGVLTVDGRGDDEFGVYTVLGELSGTDSAIRFEKQYLTQQRTLIHYTGSVDTDLGGSDPHKLSGKWATANGFDSGVWTFQPASSADERTVQLQFQRLTSTKIYTVRGMSLEPRTERAATELAANLDTVFSSSTTKLRSVKGQHQWCIEGYSLLSKSLTKGFFSRSADFSVAGHEFHLRFYPHGYDDFPDAEWVTVEFVLNRFAPERKECQTWRRMRLMNKSHDAQFFETEWYDWVFDREKYGCWFTHGAFIKRQDLISKIVADDSLTVLLELEVLETQTDPTFPFHRPVFPFGDTHATPSPPHMSPPTAVHTPAPAVVAAATHALPPVPALTFPSFATAGAGAYANPASSGGVSPSASSATASSNAAAALPPLSTPLSSSHTVSLLRDMSWLLDNPVCSDVTFHICKESGIGGDGGGGGEHAANSDSVHMMCGGEDIPCHKAVLCARSPVFRAMFSVAASASPTFASSSSPYAQLLRETNPAATTIATAKQPPSVRAAAAVATSATPNGATNPRFSFAAAAAAAGAGLPAPNSSSSAQSGHSAQSPRVAPPRTHFPAVTHSASLAQPPLHRSSSSAAQTHTPAAALASASRARSPATPPIGAATPSSGVGTGSGASTSTGTGYSNGNVRALQVGWRESTDNVIYVCDFEPVVIRALLHFCYTSQLSVHSIRTWQHAIDLFRAADMYGFPAICEAAVKLIARHLSVSNLIPTLKLADTYCFACVAPSSSASNPSSLAALHGSSIPHHQQLRDICKQFAATHVEQVVSLLSSSTIASSPLVSSTAYQPASSPTRPPQLAVTATATAATPAVSSSNPYYANTHTSSNSAAAGQHLSSLRVSPPVSPMKRTQHSSSAAAPSLMSTSALLSPLSASASASASTLNSSAAAAVAAAAAAVASRPPPPAMHMAGVALSAFKLPSAVRHGNGSVPSTPPNVSSLPFSFSQTTSGGGSGGASANPSPPPPSSLGAATAWIGPYRPAASPPISPRHINVSSSAAAAATAATAPPPVGLTIRKRPANAYADDAIPIRTVPVPASGAAAALSPSDATSPPASTGSEAVATVNAADSAVSVATAAASDDVNTRKRFKPMSGPVVFLGEKPIVKPAPKATATAAPAAAAQSDDTTLTGPSGMAPAASATASPTATAPVTASKSPRTGAAPNTTSSGSGVFSSFLARVKSDPAPPVPAGPFLPARYIGFVDHTVAAYQRAASWLLTHDENLPLVEMFILDVVSHAPTSAAQLQPPPPLNTTATTNTSAAPTDGSASATSPLSSPVSERSVVVPISVAMGLGVSSTTGSDVDIKNYVTDRSKYLCLVYRRDVKYTLTHDQNAERVLRPLLIDEARRVCARWQKHFDLLRSVEQQTQKQHSQAMTVGGGGGGGGGGEGVSGKSLEGKSAAPSDVEGSTASTLSLYELESRLAQLTLTELSVVFQSESTIAGLNSDLMELSEQIKSKQRALTAARVELDAFRAQSSATRQMLANQIAESLAAEKKRLAVEEKRQTANGSGGGTSGGTASGADEKSGSRDDSGSGLRVLCIDGGGTRGVIPTTLLEEIERRTGKRISDSFDLICGTSTGGIISLAVSTLGLTAFECRKKYLALADSVFRGNSVDKAARMLVGTTLYSAANLERFLNDTFQDVKLERASGPAAIATATAASAAAVASPNSGSGPSPVARPAQPMTFVVMRKDADPGPFLARNYELRSAASPSHANAAGNASAAGGAAGESISSFLSGPAASPSKGDVKGSVGAASPSPIAEPPLSPFAEFGHAGAVGWLAVQAARATSAAPLYFPPYVDPTGKHHFSDGGVGYNNPAEIALNELCAIRGCIPTRSHIRCIVSLGTGNTPPTDMTKQNQKMLVSQVASMLIAACASSEDVHQRMSRAAVLHDWSDRYFRFNPPLPEAFPLDTTEIEKLSEMIKHTQTYAHTPSVASQLDALSKLLHPPQ